jgi:histidinol-phosphate aminotransferase
MGILESNRGVNRREFIGTFTGAAAVALIGLDRTAMASVLDEGDSIAHGYIGRICYNENPIGPSAAAARAIANFAYDANRYPDWFGESLINDLATRHGVGTGQVIVGSGATEILRLCAMAFSSSGGNVIVPNPSYSQFPTDCELFGHAVRYVSLDENYRVDLQAIANRVDGNTTAICITNPNNPTGTIIDDGDLAAFVQSLDSDIVVIVDEAYLEYISDPGYTSVLELIRQGRNVVLVKTFSKVYGLAGARIGYAVSSGTNVGAMRHYQFISTISKSSLEGARAALTDQAHITETVILARAMKEYCYQQFSRMGLIYIPSEASFFMVDVGTNADQVRALLAERGIYVRTGWGMTQHLRVSTGTRFEMEQFIFHLRDILSGPGRRLGSLIFKSPELFQASPNPFNSSTLIRLHLPSVQSARLDIYDVQGRLVRRLLDGIAGPGEQALTWDGRDASGAPVSTGTYFYRLIAGKDVITRRMLLIK